MWGLGTQNSGIPKGTYCIFLWGVIARISGTYGLVMTTPTKNEEKHLMPYITLEVEVVAPS